MYTLRMISSYFYYVKDMDPYLEQRHVAISYEEAMAPERVAILHEDQDRIRLKQQEEAQRQAIMAKEKARKKKFEEMQQRVIRVERNNGGIRLGTLHKNR
jgi:ATPase subunit of ABC transporter with duplicated ATPase domains